MEAKSRLSRRTFLEVAGGTALATSLAGCFGVGGGQGSTSSNKSTVTIWDIDTGATQQLVQNQTTTFNNTHPNIHAIIQFYENDPYKQKLQVAMGAHNPPDIFFGWGGGILKSYVDAGDVYDLTSALNADPSWKGRYLTSVFPSVTFNGKIYGVPLNNTQPIVFFYNKDIFSKAGVTPPQTWNDLLNVVQKLKQQNVKTPIAVAGASQWTYLMYAEYLTDRYGGPSAFQNVLANKPNAWSQDAFIKAFTAIQQLVNAGAFGSTFSSVSADTNADAALLYTGKAAMMLQGTWNFPVFQTNSPSFIQGDKLGWFSFPTVEGGTGNADNLVGGPCNYYSISSASKSPQAAITYLKDAVLNPTAVSKWISLGDVPVVNGISQQLSSAPNSAWLEYVYQSVQKAPDFQLSWDQALGPTPANAVLTNLSQLFLNKITPQQFADNMNKTIGQ
ncbi:MAG TPA: extracellular solute-binding protein [Ktedonobacteraceae bacterium]